MELTVPLGEAVAVLRATGALPADFIPKMEGLWAARGTVEWASLALGVATVAGIVLVRKYAPQFCGRAVVVLILSALAWLALPSVATVTSRFGALPHGLPWPHLPPVSGALIVQMLPSAVTIALLAAIVGAVHSGTVAP